MTYTVRVAREGTNWLGTVDGLAGGHTFAGNLLALDGRMREVIALVEDLPDGAESGLDLAWDYSEVAPEAAEASQLAKERDDVDRAREQITVRTRDLVAAFAGKGWSSRDIAAVLRLSPGRISQLLSDDRSHAA